MSSVGADQNPTAGERKAREVAEAAREQKWTRPSFAKGLYLGAFDVGLIHPYPTSDPDAAARGAVFRQAFVEVCRTIDGLAIEREDHIPDEAIDALRRVGAFGMKIPQQYGGLGLSLVDYGRALMLVSTVHPSLAALLSAHQSIGVPEPVHLFGTPEQQQAYLPRCAAGAISAFLLTEPDVGSDPARLGTTATPTDDGTAYLLDGVKLWTTNGPIAELLVVMAVVPPHGDQHGDRHGGITAFVVEASTPGITVEHRNRFMGLRGMENGVTRFRQVRVPAANRLGREGEGLKIALTTLNTGRLSIPAICAGGSKWALSIARQWSTERVQWGRPVGEHEAISSKLAFIAATAFALESVFDLSARLADTGQKDVRIEAALAKLWASEMGYRVADELVQIRGGRGFETADSLAARGERAVAAEQLLRDMRINRIFEGSSEIMRLLIAREAVDTHLAAAGDLASRDAPLGAKARATVGASRFYARWYPALLTGHGSRPNAYGDFGRLAPHVRYVERSSRSLARHTFYAMARHRARLDRKQVLLGRVVDIGAELFAMSAVCTRAIAMRDEDPAAGPNAVDLADAFCAQSRLRVEDLFRGLRGSTATSDGRLARAVMAGRLRWVEDGIVDPSAGTGPWIASPTP
ncbi:putative acyl-CoA dehydrogenase FadE10 [Cellulomonas chitinilytica]|uniref:Acyl-CoA dehydrogenase FadE10 n=1 Tax=Cellulomonas chitinilytica TaxID=398759 RepID=A0A919U3W5_9CELL|nr:acyl-CoA dehydrogenase family protein [Cellulomonas chitinilytica]GIG23691.1 putative acyl-CoA dehydrogenase FadE10 [Cellulomonas chitinilytica]